MRNEFKIAGCWRVFPVEESTKMPEAPTGTVENIGVEKAPRCRNQIQW